MKDELNCSNNGGGVAYLVQSVAIHFNLIVYTKKNCKTFLYTIKGKKPILLTYKIGL